jgi:hypothetical protein
MLINVTIWFYTVWMPPKCWRIGTHNFSNSEKYCTDIPVAEEYPHNSHINSTVFWYGEYSVYTHVTMSVQFYTVWLQCAIDFFSHAYRASSYHQSSLYLPTDTRLNLLKNNFKIYIKIDIKTALTYFGVITIIMGGTTRIVRSWYWWLHRNMLELFWCQF